MLDIQFKPDSLVQRFIFERNDDYIVQTNSPEEKVIILILRDLLRIGWEVNFKSNQIAITPPKFYDKQVIKSSMEYKRQETIAKNQRWIDKHIGLARQNLADGKDAWQSEIIPVLEVCKTQRQFDVFRIFRYYWSSPYSEYVGRRLKLIIRDAALPDKPVIGIAALGSSIIHIPDRDKWIGWDKATRTKNLIFTMDAYVLGALPPYNYLLGGKLISYLIASNEVRDIFQQKYKDTVTKIAKRTVNDIACIFTTSLYGKSSQYNRVKYNENELFTHLGETKGYGTLHLTDETFEAMRELLASKGISVTNRFGDGPIWRMRVIRTAANVLGFDADFLLRHSFQRAIYVTPLATNYKEFLQGKDSRLSYYDYPLSSLVKYWHTRWFNGRRCRPEVEQAVTGFRKSEFVVKHKLLSAALYHRMRRCVTGVRKYCFINFASPLEMTQR